MAYFVGARRGLLAFTAIAGVAALGGLPVGSPADGLKAASPAAPTCKFAPIRPINIEFGAEPQLLIDGSCVDPDYNEKSFVIDKVEELTFQVPDGGPLIPYTQVTGHFPAMNTVATLPKGIRSSPRLSRQDYVWRFPAKQFWKNRSFQQQHPTGHGIVDNRMAFTNGAYSMNWVEGPAGYTHRHHAAATKLAKAYANKLYGNSAKIYAYYWGCSGGGIVSMAAAENTTGVWDGVGVHCTGPTGIAQFHSFHWQAHYSTAIPKAKRDAIGLAATPGGTGDIYAGLNEEEKAVLNEFISAGYPLAIIGNHFTNLTPLVPPGRIRVSDTSYEDDFWSKPGYAGVNPPNYLKAAHVDGYATITGITRNAQGAPTAIQLDPATIPKTGSIGDENMNFYVYAADGKTRTTDLTNRFAPALTLNGKLDRATGLLSLTGNNHPTLLKAVVVGGRIRVNNRFILSIYFYPRYSNLPGHRSYDQYRNPDGSAKYPQRKNISALSTSNYATMGGRIETGAITTKVMIMEGMADNLSWPIFNTSYAEQIQRSLGAAKSNAMMRLYLHDNGRHSVGGGEPGIFQQSMQDMMAWAERGVAPPPSSRYTIRNGQVILAEKAADRLGLQPVMKLSSNGALRITTGVNQPVELQSHIEMPPRTGLIVQYGWTTRPEGTSGTPPAPPRGQRAATQPPPPDAPMTTLPKPLPLLELNHRLSFDKPGTYVVRLTVFGQRDGQAAPANQTLLQNWKEVRVVVK